MKKFLFILLFSILTVFLLSGCADDNDNSGGNQVVEGDTGNGDSNNNGSAGDDTENGGTSSGGTGNNPDNNDPSDNPSEDMLITPTLTDLKSLQGTYDIEFFYTDGGKIAVITTDCDKVGEYGGITTCDKSPLATTSVAHKGELTIVVNNDNSLKIQSKVEMYDPTGNNKSYNIAKGNLGGGANYNFTDFNIIPLSNISNDKITGKGVNGRTATKLLTYKEDNAERNNAANSTYELTISEDGTLINHMSDTSSTTKADVIIRSKKRSNELIKLAPNTPYDSEKTDNFKYDIQYEMKNN